MLLVEKLTIDALGPYNHFLLPNEILCHIFVLAVEDCGPVAFPMGKKRPPLQLTISHVCSHWRKVALRTSELWSTTRLTCSKLTNCKLERVISLHQQWLMRARRIPVSLSIDFKEYEGSDGNEITNTLQRILLPFQVKKLHLAVTQKKFMELSSFPENMVSDLTELSLDLTIRDDDIASISDSHPFIPRLRSVAFRCDGLLDTWLDGNFQSFPWSRLRALEFDDVGVENLNAASIKILHQIPTLHMLKLRVCDCHADSLEDLTMPSLRDFNLKVNGRDGPELDRILASFTCPSLTKFTLHTSHDWTAGTFGILKHRYNMLGLQEMALYCNAKLPVSSVLQNAPFLRSISIGRNFTFDDKAIIGISNAELARFLKRLEIRCTCDGGEMLGMVKARKETVDGLIKNGCSWRDEPTILKDIVLHCKARKVHKKQINLLKKAGISVIFRG